MILLEIDKAGAEWVIVAYLSGDERMLEIIETGKSPHTVTGSLISGCSEELVERENKIVGQNTDPDTIAELRQQIPELLEGNYFLPRSMSIRQAGKKSNHGLNYGLGYKSFALYNEMDERDSAKIVSLYLNSVYTGIPIWWDSIQRELRESRTLYNCYNRRRKFLDAWGFELFEKAYAFKPQSTVVDMVNIGLRKSMSDESKEFEGLEILAQVHDSGLFQYPERGIEDLGVVVNRVALDYMSSECTYRNRTFKVGSTAKIGKDWGSMMGIEIHSDPSETLKSIKQVMEVINERQAT